MKKMMIVSILFFLIIAFGLSGLGYSSTNNSNGSGVEDSEVETSYDEFHEVENN